MTFLGQTIFFSAYNGWRMLGWKSLTIVAGTAFAAIWGAAKKVGGMGAEKDDGDEKDFISEWLGRGASALRLFGPFGTKLLRATKSKASYNQYRELHDVVHSLRKIAYGSSGIICEPKVAVEICTRLRSLLGNLLELDEQELHCCIKVLLKDADGNDRVGTLGRSEPYDHRPPELADGDAHLVAKNTVWCSLLGLNDGESMWPLFSCFGCNDLCAHPTVFKCDRDGWQRFYRSSLVFPLRYHKDETSGEFVTFGFLAFDSPKTGVFRGVPDILRYQDRWHLYHSKLAKATVFQAGAVFADTLSVLLRSAYEHTKGATGE